MATPIKNILNKFLQNKKKAIIFNENLRRAVYSQIGNNLKAHLFFASVHKESLLLYVDNPIVHYQINLLKNNILEAVQTIAPNITKLLIKTKDKNGNR